MFDKRQRSWHARKKGGKMNMVRGDIKEEIKSRWSRARRPLLVVLLLLRVRSHLGHMI